MCDKKLDCGLLECDWNDKGVCSWSNLPYENPCWHSLPVYEGDKIIFDKTNISQKEYSTFYHSTSGVYEAYVQMIEEKKKAFIEAKEDYKEFKVEYYKKEMKRLKDSIKELEVRKETLENLYNVTFNQDLI